MNHLLSIAHFICLVIPFLLYLHATPSPDPYPAIVSLPTLGKSSSQTSLSRTGPGVADVEYDLLPFVLVSTIDGALHALDREGGKARWTLKDGVEPLVGGKTKGRGLGEEYIVEPLSGNLYAFERSPDGDETSEPKIRKLPLTVEQLWVAPNFSTNAQHRNVAFHVS